MKVERGGSPDQAGRWSSARMDSRYCCLSCGWGVQSPQKESFGDFVILWGQAPHRSSWSKVTPRSSWSKVTPTTPMWGLSPEIHVRTHHLVNVNMGNGPLAGVGDPHFSSCNEFQCRNPTHVDISSESFWRRAVFGVVPSLESEQMRSPEEVLEHLALEHNVYGAVSLGGVQAGISAGGVQPGILPGHAKAS